MTYQGNNVEFLKHLKQPRKAFKDYMKQLAYEDAWGRHEELVVGHCGESNAYQTGYYGTGEWRKEGILYPYYLAGFDRFKAEPPVRDYDQNRKA